MIKRAILLASIGALVLALTPAQSKTLERKDVTFSAEPCHITCPYWMDPTSVPDPAKFDPTTSDPAPWLLGVEGVVLTDDQMWCGDNGLANYDELKVRAPKKADMLVVRAWPEVDWDIAVCRVTPSGKLRFMAYSANSTFPEDPTDPIGTFNDIVTAPNMLCQGASLSCPEKVGVAVKGGKRYVIRAYNWFDPADLPARYTFIQI